MTDDTFSTPIDPAADGSASPRIWYFAYGASMNPNSFEALRISPSRSVAAIVDLYVNF
jgi:hypothetical protein